MPTAVSENLAFWRTAKIDIKILPTSIKNF
jgi:hypothetical protein